MIRILIPQISYPKKIVLLLALFLCSSALYSQNEPSADTIVKKDSTLFYKKIQKYANKRRFTQWIFKGVFRDIKPETDVVTTKIKIKKGVPKIENFKKKQGKTIRNIHIVVIDPFGKIEGDTIAIGNSSLERFGNKMHRKTIRSAIKNQLLFEEGEPMDSLKILESERLLRQTAYLGEAKIKPLFTSDKKDSLDVLVTVRDLWTINGSAGVSSASNSIEFSEKNILGLSHEFRNAVSFDLQSTPSFTSAGNYLVPNIKHSFVAGSVFYNASTYDSGIGISFDRGFFSPLTKWAGGITVSTKHFKLPYIIPDGSIERFNAQYLAEDVWLGRGFNIHNGKFNAYKDPRVLLTARVYNLQYMKRPTFLKDTLKVNHNRQFYLSSISFSNRNYYQDKNIYGFGRIEDVPEGRLFAVIGGFEINEFFSLRPYYGFKFSYGKHLDPLGYLAVNFEYGSFIHKGKSERGVINTGFHFFNDLWTFRKWKMRQFVDLQLTTGIHRGAAESININGGNGLEGFNSEVLKGYNRSVLTFANVIYIPHKLLGFQFATILFASLASVGQSNNDLINGKVYQVYGIGLLIRNEFLVLKTIQISFGFYPEVPGVGKDIFKFNSLKISDLKFSDLYFSKPEFIGYN